MVNKRVVDAMMTAIPGGEIELRDDRIHTKWMVKIDPFLLGKYAVTQRLYAEVMHENPSVFRGEDLPVENVTWKEAVLFCNKLSGLNGLDTCYAFEENETISVDMEKNGFRLPTEAEWEFACKAGTNGIRYGDIENIAWYKANSEQKTHTVGTKDPNP
jgi:formylglycine-generating enzyme required for sulfatase activity